MLIEDYAVIGDCETAALVGRDGSIDWLCLPRFDSAACFAALLGTPEHGRWLLAPKDEVRGVRRRYRDGTMVLETEFETAQGCVAIVDCMPPHVPDVVRYVEGREGRVAMRMELIIRFEYGAVVPWVRRAERGITAIAGPDGLLLETPIATHGEDLRTVAEFSVSAGERVPFRLSWYRSHESPPSRMDDVAARIAETEAWWRAWSGRCTYEGEWRDAVVRSFLTLKALTYAPTGGVVAAVTTSLPELIGGVRNWDYRYCWLRDATFTLYALMIGGYLDESRAWRDWLVRAVAGQPSQGQIVYGVAGERLLPELVLPWLPGYEASVPVRIGNAASQQFQLDIYGEVMDALHVARRTGLLPSEDAWRVERLLVRYVESVWRDPDEGIWEVRGGRRHFTHSKVMAWVALDRAVKAVERFGLAGPVDRWRAVRAAIHEDVCRHGFDATVGAFVQSYGSTVPDASLLMIPLVGFLPPSDPRVLGTMNVVRERLTSDGFVARYQPMPDVDGLPHGEAAFLPCTLWLADNLALQGRPDEAREVFERVLAVRNDVGLLAEEYDPTARRLLGNFPQALSHVGLINTARNLTRAGGPAERRAVQQ